MYRNELKYSINRMQKEIIIQKLKHVCNNDRFSDENGGYRVSSLYFDDLQNSAVEDKISGLCNRKKFRIRVYNFNDDNIKLERKEKQGSACLKTSVNLTKQEYIKILVGDIDFMIKKNNPVARDFYIASKTRLLKPKVIVDYRREAYIYKLGVVRITFDYNLKSSINRTNLLSNRFFIPAMEENEIILEVKFTGYLPKSIQDIIQLGNVTQQAISKYTRCRIIELEEKV